jgi:thiamine biosynthesis lipoprotein ApbE
VCATYLDDGGAENNAREGSLAEELARGLHELEPLGRVHAIKSESSQLNRATKLQPVVSKATYGLEELLLDLDQLGQILVLPFLCD